MVSAGSAATLTYSRRVPVEELEQFCVTPGGCVNTEPFVPILVFLLTGLLLLVLTVTVLRGARSVLDEERDRARAERDAFAAFASRVAALDVSEAEAPAAAGGGVTPLLSPATGGQLERIKDVYRNTVMATPHYDEEYDEPIAVNMAAELSEEVAASVTEGETLTRHLKDALVRQAEAARAQREEFIEQLDREAEDLADASETLSDVETTLASVEAPSLRRMPFPELQSAWERLGELEERCRELVAERQRSIRDLPGWRRSDAPTLQEYLYQPLPVTYPVLSAGATATENLREARDRLATAISRRS